MKKFLLSVSAIAAMLFAGSCQKEAFNPVSAGDVAVKLAIELPTQVETKAMSQAETTDIVYYEIWNSDWSKQLYPVNNDALASEVVQNKKATLELTLVSDQTYNFIFWAQNAACGAYDVNELKNVKVDYDVIANPGNQDKFDAFYAVKTITVNGAINETVTLYRPFAQLNFGTTRMESSFGPVEVGATEITVSQLATVFNTLEGVGENQTGAVTFMAEDLATSEMLKTNGQSYTWVTMDYMLMMNEQDVVEVAASFDLGMDVPVEHLIANVPLKKNYRTNIVGDLFTADAVLNIIVDPAFLQPDEVITAGVAEEIVPVDGVYNVEKPGHILWLSKQSNEDVSVFSGKTIRFAADIDMMGQGFLPIQLNPKNSVKIEGQGHKVYNFSVRADDYRNPETGKTVGEAAGLFGSVKGSITDLHVEDVLVESNHYAGALVGYIYGSVKNCSARNVEIVSAPYYSIKDGMFVYDEGNNAGGLIGYVGEHGTGYVLSENTVVDATVTGYRNVGGLVGTIQTNAKVDNNTVTDVTVTINQTYKPYFEAPKAPKAGEIVGRAISTDDLSDNTVENVSIANVYSAATAAELQKLLDENAAPNHTLILFEADLAGDVTIKQAEGKNIVIDGCGYKYDGTITVNGDARANGAETLTFTGINFETATDGITFISAPSKVAGRYNYSHNVAIENCTFTGNHTVGSANFTGTYNLTMKDCVANNMHSALQVQSCGTAVVVDNVKVNNGKNGVSFGNTAFPTLKNSVINAAGYGVRGDGDASRGNLVIENTTITADLPVVIRKVTTDGYAVALNGGSLETISGYDVVFTKGSDDAAFVAPEASFSISGADNYVVFPGKFAARTAADLQAILDAATSDVYVVLAADIKGNATVDQKEGVNVVIDGQKNKFDGTIYVNGHSRSNGAETLTIKNVDFESATVVDFISSNSSSDGKIRYAHNVAVEGCSFVGTAADAVAIRTRQAYNISVKNCTAELGHSFAQLTSTAGFYAEGVTVDAPRGFNLGNSNTEATFVECNITATKGDGYGIRFDNGAVLNVTGCAVSAYEPVVFRNNTAACQFNLSASTLTAAGGYEVVVESGVAPVMTGVDGLNVKNN